MLRDLHRADESLDYENVLFENCGTGFLASMVRAQALKNQGCREKDSPDRVTNALLRDGVSAPDQAVALFPLVGRTIPAAHCPSVSWYPLGGPADGLRDPFR